MPDPNEREWKRFYRERYARDWEQFARSLATQRHHRLYQEACLEYVRAARPKRILEVGVGRGDLLVRLCETQAELVGSDISIDNLGAACSTLRDCGCPTLLCCADAEDLPFCDGCFDVVYAFSVLWYLPYPARAVAEMARVTRRGGRLVFDMLNAIHVTSAAYHLARIAARRLGRERGRTRLASPGTVRSWAEPHCTDVKVMGSYVLLPAGLPMLGEKANFFRLVPKRAAAMTDSTWKYLAHKLTVVAIRR